MGSSRGTHKSGRTPNGICPEGEIGMPQIAQQRFQSAVRGQLLAHELRAQLSLDRSAQARYVEARR